MNENLKPGVLVIEGGKIFEGFLFGAPTSVDSIRSAIRAKQDKGFGEVCFNTSLTGYQEILTDPSYYGQMICMTVPHVGNTGVNHEDPESAHPWCAGFIIREKSISPSNWRSESDLDSYLKQHKIPAICGIDTRALTRHLRSSGVVRGVILPREEQGRAAELLRELPSFEGRDLISEVSTEKSYAWPLAGRSGKSKNFKVVAVDLGIKWNLLRSLDAQGCELEVVSAQTTAKEILAKKPDGVFLSNGPGDPSAAPYAAEMVRGILGKVPVFGVCMGHQILSLALGASTFKLKFGHRGANQPVFEERTKKVEISSQNHGYAVDPKSIPAGVEITHVNLNDRTCEGIAVPNQWAFSVQYHPEACPGPHDSEELFERFTKMMEDFRVRSKR